MRPPGPRSATVDVVGDSRVSAVLERDLDEVSFELRVRESDATEYEPNGDQPPDCVVVATRQSGEGRDCLSVVETVDSAHPRAPVIVLPDGSYEERAAEALQAGASECLPRSLVREAPETISERIVSRVRSARAQTGVRAIYDNVTELVTLHDPDTGRIVHANEAIRDLLGYERGELNAMAVKEFTAEVIGYDQARAMELVRSAIDDGEVGPIEWPLETKTGERRWVESHLTPVRIGGRELVLASSTDVTDRRRREREFEQLYNAVNDAITVHDPESAEIIDVNDTFCDLLGYDRETILEMEISDFSRTDLGYTTERGREFIRGTGDDEAPTQTEWALETADGETRWVEVHGTVAEIGGEERFVAIDRDVTEAKRREREYEQIFNTVNDSITVHDPDTGEMVDVNDTFCDLLGYDRETVLELGIDGVSVTEEGYTAERAKSVIREVVQEDTTETLEWLVETADGEHRRVEVTATTGTIGGEQRYISHIRDITERRRREREYEQIFDGVNDIVAVHDPDTREMVDVNSTMCELTGYDKETILDRGADGLLVEHPDSDVAPDRVPEMIDRVMDGEVVDPYEQVIETADGDRVWIEVNPTRAVIGGEERFLAISRDITEAKRREREYEQIFDGVNDAITVFDPETGAIVDVNETYHDMLGYDDIGRIRELGIEGLSATEEGYTRERGEALVREVAETGDPETVEWRGERADGERIWIEATLAPVEIGGEERVVSMQRDITERKRRQQEFEQIFNGVNDIVNVYDPETKELLEINDTMCSLLGYDREEILERDVEGVSATGLGYTRDRVESVIDRVTREDEPVEGIEWALRGAGGQIVWVEVNATPATINGEERVLAIARDVTGRKDREERVQVLNRVLRHNLRNDMDAVKGFAEMLAADPQEYDHYAERIKTVADDLVELGEKARDVESVLTRREAGRIKPLPEVIEQSVEEVRSSFPGARITVELHDSDIRVDGSILGAVLRELLENAIEHNDAATPRVAVRTARTESSEYAVELRVIDNGPGIPEGEVSTLEHGQETDLEHGQGLGLWLIKWGIRQVNGRIEFGTDDTGGTAAVLYLSGV